MMIGILAAAVLAAGAADDPASSPSPAPAARVKPSVRRVRLPKVAGSDNSNSSYAALGLRAVILPSWAPDWMERAACRLLKRLSWIRGLKPGLRDSILVGLERAHEPGRFKS
jgi:hypothetical protein